MFYICERFIRIQIRNNEVIILFMSGLWSFFPQLSFQFVNIKLLKRWSYSFETFDTISEVTWKFFLNLIIHFFSLINWKEIVENLNFRRIHAELSVVWYCLTNKFWFSNVRWSSTILCKSMFFSKRYPNNCWHCCIFQYFTSKFSYYMRQMLFLNVPFVLKLKL